MHFLNFSAALAGSYGILLNTFFRCIYKEFNPDVYTVESVTIEWFNKWSYCAHQGSKKAEEEESLKGGRSHSL